MNAPFRPEPRHWSEHEQDDNHEGSGLAPMLVVGGAFWLFVAAAVFGIIFAIVSIVRGLS